MEVTGVCPETPIAMHYIVYELAASIPQSSVT
jgi:hypothetical protein